MQFTLTLFFFNSSNISNNLDSVNENDLLSKIIELSATNDKPILVKDNQNQKVGIISQTNILKAVIEGNDEG